MKLRFYHYWRSSTSWRVRWAVALKNIPCDYVTINLLENEQRSPDHLSRNPAGTVPVLEIRESEKSPPRFLAESLAIIEWAEESFPKPALLPGDPWQRGRIRQIAELINAGIQPFQNSKVQQKYSGDPQKQKEWSQHWIRLGMTALEQLVKQTAGKFSVGDQITLADLCVVPQCYSALRFEVPLGEFPTVERIYAEALKTPACQASHPDRFKPA